MMLLQVGASQEQKRGVRAGDRARSEAGVLSEHARRRVNDAIEYLSLNSSVCLELEV
jgi:hypothetical protein